jgi:hypothetical protein
MSDPGSTVPAESVPTAAAVDRALKMQAGSVLARQVLHLRSMMAERTAAVGDAANRYMAERARVAAVRALARDLDREAGIATDIWTKSAMGSAAARIRAALGGSAGSPETGDSTPALPRRDDHVAAWLKQRRDGYVPSDAGWVVLDYALDNYRLHADTGTPLDQHACEGPYCCRDEGSTAGSLAGDSHG